MNDDMLKGCAQIAAYLNETPRATYHKLEARQLPAFQIGATWYARKSTLDRHFAKLEEQHLAGRSSETSAPPPRKRGRPKGSRNRPKVEPMAQSAGAAE